MVPPGAVDEAHDSGFDLLPEPLTNYRHQVEFVSLRNFVAMILRSTGIPTPLIDSSSSTAPHANLDSVGRCGSSSASHEGVEG